MGVLPLEILSLIIDQVAADESGGKLVRAKTLRACSLASRSFLDQSQKHLFTRIQMTIDSQALEVAGRLLAVYNVNEGLLAKLRYLTLVFNMQNSGGPADFLHDAGPDDAFDPVEKQGITKLRSLLTIFARANLLSLTIMARNGFLNWSRMSRQSQDLFLAIRAAPTLRSIHCERIINLDREMISPKGLQRLALGLNIDIPFSSSIVGGDALNASAMENLSSLTQLEIDHTALFHFLPPPWRVAANYLPQLRSLVITLPRDNASRLEVMKFISHIGKQLHTLRLTSVWYPHPDMGISNEAFFGAFSYDDLPNLHHLILENGAGHSRLSTSFFAFANILMHAYGAGSMSIKVLDIRLDLFPSAMRELNLSPRVDIDEVLTNSALVGRLHDISVHIVVHRDSQGDPTELVNGIRSSEDLRRFFPRTSVHENINLYLYLTYL